MKKGPTGASSGIEYSPAARKRARKRREAAQARLDAKCKRLAGPVTITYLPRTVGGEQPVRASSDESQQPRDDPATSGETPG
jgi:hypothetical protein